MKDTGSNVDNSLQDDVVMTEGTSILKKFHDDDPLQELVELFHECNSYWSAKVEIVDPSLAEKSQSSFLELLAAQSTSSTSFRTDTLQFIESIFKEAKNVFSCIDKRETQHHKFMVEACQQGFSFLFTHVDSINSELGYESVLNPIENILSTLIEFKSYVMVNHGHPLDFSLLVLVWKNLTKICGQFGSTLFKFRALRAVVILDELRGSITQHQDAFLHVISLYTPQDNTIFSHIQALRILIKGVRGIISSISSHVDHDKFISFWIAFASLARMLFLRKVSNTLDEKLLSYIQLVHDDIMTTIQALLLPTSSDSLNDSENIQLLSLIELIKHDFTSWTNSPLDQLLLLIPYIQHNTHCMMNNMKTNDDEVNIMDIVMKAVSNLMKLTSHKFKNHIIHLVLEPVVTYILVSCTRPTTTSSIQMELIKYSFHDENCIRSLSKYIWIQLFHIWNEHHTHIGNSYVNFFLSIAISPDENASFEHRIHASTLLTDLFPVLNSEQKMSCINTFGETLEEMCSEGPSFQFNTIKKHKIDLMGYFSTRIKYISYLDDKNLEDFFERYLQMCYECSGTAFEFLSEEILNQEDIDEGILRLVDGTLLMLRSLYTAMRVQNSVGEEKLIILNSTLSLVIQILDILPLDPTNQHSTRMMQSCVYLFIVFDESHKQNHENNYFRILKFLIRCSKHKEFIFQCGILLQHISPLQIPPASTDMDMAKVMIPIVYKQILGHDLWPVYSLTIESLSEFLAMSNESICQSISKSLEKTHILNAIHLLAKKSEDTSQAREEFPSNWNSAITIQTLAKKMDSNRKRRHQDQWKILLDLCNNAKRICSSEISNEECMEIPETDFNEFRQSIEKFIGRIKK